MAGTKTRRSEIDRFSGHAITSVSKNTPAQQKIVDEINAANKRKVTIKTTTRTKKK